MAGRFKKTPLLCLLWCYITASLLDLSPARNGEQWAGCATRSSAWLAKSDAVFHAIVPYNRRIIQPTVTHSSQSGSHKWTPGCVYKRNVGHKGSPGAIWLKMCFMKCYFLFLQILSCLCILFVCGICEILWVGLCRIY